MTGADLLTPAFRALSARLGQDPLQVQGPGGNTSVKNAAVMWIKASGTELANAVESEIFVAVDRNAALKEAREEAGDGSCKSTVLDRDWQPDPAPPLRPSIETTFHAALDWPVVAHTHSVATLTHVISPEGRAAAAEKLAGLPFVQVPYAKPGLPLTREILARITPQTQIILLQNHGLICCGHRVEEVSDLIAAVETRLALPSQDTSVSLPKDVSPEGFAWAAESWLARDARAERLAREGTYYPDHVVFLGPALPCTDHDGARPVVLVPGTGVLIRTDATPSQRAMLRCLSDVLARLPQAWTAEAIGPEAEASLLDWDAEKYRQALAAQVARAADS